jgi:hydroxypyruvate reductase
MKEKLQKLNSDTNIIFQAALKAVDPYTLVKQSLKLNGSILIIDTPSAKKTFDLTKFRRIFVVGGGKAVAPMGRAIEEILGARLTRGIINVKYGYIEKLNKMKIIEAGHPIPDDAGVRGVEGIITLIKGSGESDLVLSLISGGGSALLPAPVNGIKLSEKQELTHLLLNCGADIWEINAIRKHISQIKGGRLAELAYPSTTINLALSDVVSDKMDTISSGPTVPDSSTFKDAWHILEKYDLLNEVSTTIREYLREGVEGKIKEIPKPGDKVFKKTYNFIIGNNMTALKAALAEARALGYNTLMLSSSIEGEAREVAKVYVAIAQEILSTSNPIPSPACVISGGETTVTIKGDGKGGRNQEFALAAAIDIDGLDNVVIASIGSDGTDGPTDAAGGIVNGDTIKNAMSMGLNPSQYLNNNDSYNFLKQVEALIFTGPTNTNVMDIQLILVS